MLAAQVNIRGGEHAEVTMGKKLSGTEEDSRHGGLLWDGGGRVVLNEEMLGCPTALETPRKERKECHKTDFAEACENRGGGRNKADQSGLRRTDHIRMGGGRSCGKKRAVS